jgi:hypothetical protein
MPYLGLLLAGLMFNMEQQVLVKNRNVEEGNTEHLSAFNIILKILRNIFSGIFFHRRPNE